MTLSIAIICLCLGLTWQVIARQARDIARLKAEVVVLRDSLRLLRQVTARGFETAAKDAADDSDNN